MMIANSAESDESGIVQFLRSGVPIVDVMERRDDVVDGACVAETASIRTDGSWFWREDLAHYVEKFHIALPVAFREHAAELGFCVPELSDSEIRSAFAAIRGQW